MKFLGSRSCLLAAAIAAFAASGCSNDSSGTSAERAATELAQAVCEVSMGCCSEGEIHWFFGGFVDPESCAEHLLAASAYSSGTEFGVPYTNNGAWFPNLAALEAAVEEGDIRVNRAALDECLETIRAGSCNAEDEPSSEECVPREPYGEEDDYPCSPEAIFEGTVDEGDACNQAMLQGLDCADDMYCIDGDSFGGPVVVAAVAKELPKDGICVRRLHADEACVDDEQCEPGLYCAELTGTCQPPRALGEDCQYADPSDTLPSSAALLIGCDYHLTCSPFSQTCVADCERGAYCYDEEDCPGDLVCVKRSYFGSGFCDEPRTEGACSEDSDCAPGYGCDDTDAGDSVPGECYALGGVGDDCTTHAECATGYCENGTSCAAQAAPTEACASGLNEQCANGYCVAAVCEGKKADGAACTDDFQCVSGECVNPTMVADAGTCESSPRALGEPCESNAQCASGACNLAEDPPSCVELPLADGEPCTFALQCASYVCDMGMCGPGLAIGADCGPGLTPCDPFVAFCDTEATSPKCTAIHETGEECTRDLECRSKDCELRSGRYLCEPAAEPNQLICDGV